MKIKHGMILAAGLGKRMQPLTLSKPKPLINIGNKTNISYIKNIIIIIYYYIKHKCTPS